ncbi:hypothetical protein BKA69DRAFT_1080545 [Paraphysoderma sedebokerense]|nr:hypothetical protein BKA69DRAFT_1080545 [Paraphysoderma sedebokerense]
MTFSKPSHSLSAYLAAKTIAETILPHIAFQNLVSCDIDQTTVEECYDLLHQHQLRAIPVYETVDANTKKWRGIVTLFDLLSYSVFQPVLSQEKLTETHFFPDPSVTEFFIHPISYAVGYSAESTSQYVVTPETDIKTLLEIFSSGVHYVLVAPVIDDSQSGGENGENGEEEVVITGNEEPRIISQSDVIEWLNRTSHDNMWNEVKDIEVSNVMNRVAKIEAEKEGVEIGFVSDIRTRGVVAVSLNDTALQAFKRMFHYKVTSVVILNEAQRVVGVLSASDIRGLNRYRLKSLLEPVLTFLQHCRGIVRDPLAVSESTKVAETLTQFAEGQVHQLVVIDKTAPAEGKPVGIVSMSDICSILVNGKSEPAVPQQSHIQKYVRNLITSTVPPSSSYPYKHQPNCNRSHVGHCVFSNPMTSTFSHPHASSPLDVPNTGGRGGVDFKSASPMEFGFRGQK